jgi:Holliday junction resolvasome RuvABC endonuclease subunit
MTRATDTSILGVHPTSRGFGWVLLEEPLSPIDWGASTPQGDKHMGTLARLETILNRYQPGTLAIEEFAMKPARQARVIHTAEAMIALASACGLEVAIYPLAIVRAAFRNAGARTRAQIAGAVAVKMPALRHRLPPRQKIWVGEHPNSALFCAAAAALTCCAERTIR